MKRMLTLARLDVGGSDTDIGVLPNILNRRMQLALGAHGSQ
jgi:hypothetical protein